MFPAFPLPPPTFISSSKMIIFADRTEHSCGGSRKTWKTSIVSRLLSFKRSIVICLKDSLGSNTIFMSFTSVKSLPSTAEFEIVDRPIRAENQQSWYSILSDENLAECDAGGISFGFNLMYKVNQFCKYWVLFYLFFEFQIFSFNIMPYPFWCNSPMAENGDKNLVIPFRNKLMLQSYRV